MVKHKVPKLCEKCPRDIFSKIFCPILQYRPDEAVCVIEEREKDEKEERKENSTNSSRYMPLL